MLVDLLAQPFDLIVLPGGAVGAQHLAAHQPLQQLLKDQASAGRLFAAIAEAPAIPASLGVLRQRRMTCLPRPAINCRAARLLINRWWSTAIASPPRAPAPHWRLP
jgi:4-methyl-5(b-hydroxyethyl)-thiazole monophosphate biosynthesis